MSLAFGDLLYAWAVSYQQLKQVGFLVRPALPDRIGSYILSPGVTFRGSRGRLVQNIDSGIDIPIMDSVTFRTLPLAHLKRDRFHDRATRRTGFGRRIPTADRLDVAAVPAALVGQHCGKSRPADIANGLCQMMICHHAPDIQIFQPDETVLLDKLTAQFVVKIPALIGNPLIQTGQAQAGFFPIAAPGLLAGELACQSAALLLRSPVVLRGRNLLTGRQHGKLAQAKIETNRMAAIHRFRKFHFHLKADEVVPAFGSRYGDILHRACQWTVHDQSHMPYFRQVDMFAIGSKPAFLRLRVAYALPCPLAFEFGIACPLVEEVLECPIQVLERLLQYLGMRFSQLDCFFGGFQNGQALCQVVVAGVFATFAASQPPIVDVSGVSKLDSEALLLFPVWIDAILEGFADDHLPFCSSMYCLTTSSDTAPTEAMKRERVHIEGNLDFIHGYSLRIVWAVYPLILRTTASIPIRGSTSRRRCT